MWCQVLFCLVSTIAFSSTHVLLDSTTDNILSWPDEYYYSAESIDLKNDFIETYEVWYGGITNRSRRDYFDGTYKEYYIAESDEDIGYVFRIHPVTNETDKNVISCFRDYHGGEHPNFLPDPEGFEYVEEMELDGKQVRVWKKQKYNDETEEYKVAHIYVYTGENGYDVPIKVATELHSTSKGALIGHIIINFKRFSFRVDEEDVTYENEEKCEDMVNLNMDFKSHLSHLSPYHPLHIHEAFNSYKKHHKKEYKTNEHERRKAIFHRNWKRVVAHNSRNLSYKMEINQFSDRTPEELQRLAGTRPSDPFVQGTLPFPYSEEELVALSEGLPESYDMRSKGFLGPVKNQGDCGSCWAFSTTASVEGMYARTYGGRILDLSEQSLVDCAWGFDNLGCDGGLLDHAFQYILTHGIPKESSYGNYLQKDGYCKLTNTSETFKIKGFARVTPHSPAALKAALVHFGPVAVAIHAGGDMYQYASGVYYDPDCTGSSPNHGVVVVGYGNRDGTPYWVVRNSWGVDFGLEGYILMSQIDNNCLVMDMPMYPIV